MPTITNRPKGAKSYYRARQNLSRQLRAFHVGEMTMQEFQVMCEDIAQRNNARSIEYQNNKATIHFFGGLQAKQYSYTPVYHPVHVASDMGDLRWD